MTPGAGVETSAAVVGAGIKGCAIAAFLSLLGARVVLYERDVVASDTTSRNHGRLHLGVAGWATEFDDEPLVNRRIAGSTITRRFADLREAPLPAHYWFSDHSFEKFEAFLEKFSLPRRVVTASAAADPWIRQRVKRAYELDEFGFDPARLAGRLAAVAARSGEVRTHSTVRTATIRSERIELRGDARDVDVDLVVVASGWHSSDIDVVDRPSLVDIEAQTWRVLCGRLQRSRSLRRVLVMADADGESPSMVGHGRLVTFDHKAQPMAPSTEQTDQLLSLDEDAAGRDVLDRVTRWYDLSGLMPGSIRVFTGTQGRLRDAAPGSVGEMYSYPDGANYFVAVGGQASTAILDALDVVVELQRRGVVPELLDREALLDELASTMGVERFIATSEMIWRRLESVE